MRVLYVGHLGKTESSLFRRNAIQRLGHDVVDFDMTPYQSSGGRLVSAIRIRTLLDWVVHRLNRDLLRLAAEVRPQLVWFDKALFVQPRTVKALRDQGALTVHYCIDNPFGPRRDPGWRLILKALPDYDLHLVQRDVNFGDYRAAGARDVQMLRTAYEPSVHFPPPQGWSDADRAYDVVFIGSPYDRRASFLAELGGRCGVPLRIWGTGLWKTELPEFYQGRPLFNDDYRETLWRSKIALSFVTHSNCDDVAHKSFEIAACGAFLLAEDTPGHRDHFEEGREAVFFRSVEDCADKIRRYLGDEAERARIAEGGRLRALSAGYGNDARIARVFAYLGSKYGLGQAE